jgi:asparagine synthase (glutamine-hydrolysing)
MTAALSTLRRTKSLPALLRYLDRNGMAWSIEPRVPFLDRRVAAASYALSRDERFSGALGKSVLRDPRWSRLPPLVAARREKNGFFTPEASWWRGPLRGWAADVLDPRSVARHGVLDRATAAYVRDGLRSDTGPAPPASLWRWINIELWMEARERRCAGRVG